MHLNFENFMLLKLKTIVICILVGIFLSYMWILQNGVAPFTLEC